MIDDHTIAFTLSAPNVAFLDYMTMAILPKHLLEGEDMQESDFFRHPIGTGPYKLDSWDAGQAITLVKNEDYFKGNPMSSYHNMCNHPDLQRSSHPSVSVMQDPVLRTASGSLLHYHPVRS